MGKQISVVSNELCNGCRNCEMWCSFSNGTTAEFSPYRGKISVKTHPQGVVNVVRAVCDAAGCHLNEEGDPLCVEMCPTGTLVFCDEMELEQMKAELKEKRTKQPLFKLIAPWKYPYPFGEWTGGNKDD